MNRPRSSRAAMCRRWRTAWLNRDAAAGAISDVVTKFMNSHAGFEERRCRAREGSEDQVSEVAKRRAR